jgi:hypothetical protein
MSAAVRSQPPTHLSPEERVVKGKTARKRSPRTSHGEWSPNQRTHDPLDLLTQQETTRLPDLVPIRHGRMAASPFAYYRGAALPMAADLSTTPSSGIEVQLCGDAHLSNFGGFASPERDLVFDVNDFDETAPGPFEWDVKRLAASLEIAGRARGFDAATNRTIALEALSTYRTTINRFAHQHKLDIWYAKLDVPAIMELWGAEAGNAALKAFQRAVQKAESKDRLKAASRLTHLVDGELAFLSDPPLLMPVEELFESPDDAEVLSTGVHEALRSYRRTLASDRRRLLSEYRYIALARKVVGVGSVGTRCWVALFVGRDVNDPLFLQVKEAEASVLERFGSKVSVTNHGQRVVEGQRVMQAASDIFLGWQRVDGIDGVRRDFYVRQLWDWKASAGIETMEPRLFPIYAGMCGWTLARAHARSGDEVALAAYLGAGDVFDNAVADFAVAYADQNEVDHAALVTAIKDGRLTAEMGI